MSIYPNRLGSDIGLADLLDATFSDHLGSNFQWKWLAEGLGIERFRVAVDADCDVKDGKVGEQAIVREKNAAPIHSNQVGEINKFFELLDFSREEPAKFDVIFSDDMEMINRAEELAPASVEEVQARPEYFPLFRDNWLRAIISGAMSTLSETRVIDFARIRHNKSSEFLLNRVPYKRKATLARGMRVLLDRSSSMEPFLRDEVELIRRLRRLLGPTLIQWTWFDLEVGDNGLASAGLHNSLAEEVGNVRPVLLVSNLGIGGTRATNLVTQESDWVEFVSKLQHASGHVCALIPASPEFWPFDIRKMIAVALPWDFETSPNSALRARII